MRINLFSAGQTSGNINDGSFPTSNVKGGVHYAAHLANRHVVLPFVFDGTWHKFTGVIEDTKGVGFSDGDSMATHWLYEGSKVTDIVAHVKGETAGVTLTAQLRKVSDNSTVGEPLTISLDKKDYIRLDPKKAIFLKEDAYLDVAIAGGNVKSSCFSIMVELVYFNDQHDCGCRREPCEVEYPEPMCV